MKLINLVLVFCVCFCVAEAQTKQEPGEKEYVVAPKENTLISVASQYDCPLRIEEAQLLLSTAKSWDFRFRYRVRNVSEKTVKRYTISFLTSVGTGGTLSDNRLALKALMPGTVTLLEDSDTSIIPLTKELAARLKLGPPMKMVVVLLVEKVVFSDGTIFSDELVADSARKYFAELSGARE